MVEPTKRAPSYRVVYKDYDVVKNNRPPIWEWFIQTIDGEIADGLSPLYQH